MKRKRGPLAGKLRLRVNALEEARSFDDLRLLDPQGKWHQLMADRAGQWAGRLSPNWRLVVEEAGADDVSVLVIEIEDYH